LKIAIVIVDPIAEERPTINYQRHLYIAEKYILANYNFVADNTGLSSFL